MTIEDAEDLAAALPAQARLVRFDDAGHMLPLEHPEHVVGLIRDFVLEA